ncbi:MAG: arsenite methyltransferase [Halobacteriota archaeon]
MRSDEPSVSETRRAVRKRYGSIAEDATDGCCSETSCCQPTELETRTEQLGYDDADVVSAPAGANLGLGCGNPKAIASLQAGETVVDLGSGGGFDCFLAAREVGPAGRVIGVDMTPKMIERARSNAETADTSTVEFRLGEIEHLPIADGVADVVISNCVINLSPEKSQVFEEAFRVLRPGGRLAIADVVLTADLPAEIRGDLDSIAGCVGGASSIDELQSTIERAGFLDVSIDPKSESETFIREWSDDHDPSEYVVSASITGQKPDRARTDSCP